MQTETPTSRPKRLPILPLRDVVVYPHMVIPLFVGRERSVAALDQAMAGGRRSCSSPRRSPTSTIRVRRTSTRSARSRRSCSC